MSAPAVAVIPARGGSKRIPLKNIRMFHGKPMLAWPIDAARASGLFARVIVSTDDPEIARVARSCGAETPFVRPEALSDDQAGVTEVVAHATAWARREDPGVAEVCCIYATAPFLLAADLARGLAALRSGPWSFALAATPFAAAVARAFRERREGGLEMLFPDQFHTRSQDLPEVLHDAAQFCWGTAEAWLERRRVFDAHTVPVRLPAWRVQDIDTPDDWTRAELLAPAVFAAMTREGHA